MYFKVVPIMQDKYNFYSMSWQITREENILTTFRWYDDLCKFLFYNLLDYDIVDDCGIFNLSSKNVDGKQEYGPKDSEIVPALTIKAKTKKWLVDNKRWKE